MGNSDYLPPGLPFNRGDWPQEYRDMEYFDMKASALIKKLSSGKVTRQKIETELENVDKRYKEHFRSRLNHWREYSIKKDERG